MIFVITEIVIVEFTNNREQGTGNMEQIDCSNDSGTPKQLAKKLEKLGKKPRCNSLITTKYRESDVSEQFLHVR